LRLFQQRGGDARMTVSLIDGRVGADAVEIFFSVDVPQPYAFGAIDDEVQRMIVMRAVAFFEGDEIAGTFREYRHRMLSNAPRVFTAGRAGPRGRHRPAFEEHFER